MISQISIYKDLPIILLATRKDTPQTSTERNLSTTSSYPNSQISTSSPSATLSGSSTDQTLPTATSPQISTTPDIKGNITLKKIQLNFIIHEKT